MANDADAGTSGRGLVSLTAGAWAGRRAGQANVKDQEQARRDNIKLLETLDFEPEYASQHVPTFQKTQSPIARSYLESMLLGQNPDSTFSGATNAGAIRAAQARTMSNLYGPLGARAAEAAAVQRQTPWKVTPPERVISPSSLLGSTSAKGVAAQEKAHVERLQGIKERMAARAARGGRADFTGSRR